MYTSNKILDLFIKEKVITGYNFFPKTHVDLFPNSIRFSNLHQTAAYLEDVQNDLFRLGYPSSTTSLDIRKKVGMARWFPKDIIRDSKGSLLSGLKIRKGGQYLKLEDIPFQNLLEAGFSKLEIAQFIAETEGYEIILCSQSKEEIMLLANLFLEKSKRGTITSWRDAYQRPFITISGLEEHFPEFRIAEKGSLFPQEEEYSFVTKGLPESCQKELEKQGFIFEGIQINRGIRI